jgi:hypothetical protein
MKQYTSNDQTAKLIELGFEPETKIKGVRTVHSNVKIDHVWNFTIGELIKTLGVHLSSIYYIGIEWFVNAEGMECRREELVDALYEMIVRLKEKGVI